MIGKGMHLWLKGDASMLVDDLDGSEDLWVTRPPMRGFFIKAAGTPELVEGPMARLSLEDGRWIEIDARLMVRSFDERRYAYVASLMPGDKLIGPQPGIVESVDIVDPHGMIALPSLEGALFTVEGIEFMAPRILTTADAKSA